MTTYLSEWPKSRKLKMPNAGENVEHRNSHSFLLGMQKGMTTLEDKLEVSYKTIHTLIIHASCYLPEGAENLCAHKNLHTDVYNHFIHNLQNLEATNMSFSR